MLNLRMVSRPVLGTRPTGQGVTAGLFELERVEKRIGNGVMVPASSIFCAWCGPTYLTEYAQPALFRYGGYGATEGKRIRTCACGAFFSVSYFTVNPRWD